jgi:hypothetical protein
MASGALVTEDNPLAGPLDARWLGYALHGTRNASPAFIFAA